MVSSSRIGEVLGLFFQKNSISFLFFLLVFAMGIIYGTGSLGPMPFSSRLLLLQDLGFSSPLTLLAGISPLSFGEQVFFSFKHLFFFYLLGLSLIGVFFIPILVFFRGFILGFTIGFLMKEFSFYGILLVLILVIPQNLFLLPVLMTAGVTGVSFSLSVVTHYLSQRPFYLLKALFDYHLLFLLLTIPLILASLIEVFLLPPLFTLFTFFFF